MLWNHNSAAGATGALIAVCVVTLASPFEALAQQRQGGEGLDSRPAAVIERTGGEPAETISLSVFSHRALDGDARFSWRVIVTDPQGSARELDRSVCPAVFRAISKLERMAIPRVEIRPGELVDGQFPDPPNLGTMHQSYRATLSAFSADNAPVEITLSHLGAGPIRDWWDAARVEECLNR